MTMIFNLPKEGVHFSEGNSVKSDIPVLIHWTQFFPEMTVQEITQV
jgi:hypothetical protein